MHRAVEIDPRGASLVRGKDSFDRLIVGNAGGALVVDDDVVAFRVFRHAVDRKVRLHGAVVGMDLVNDDVRTAFDTFLEDILLRLVIVAAAAC